MFSKFGTRFAQATLMAALLGAPAGAAAEEEKGRQLTPDKAVALAVRHNPGLESAKLAEKQARQGVRAEEGRYPYTLGADASYTRSVIPSLAPGGGVTKNVRETYLVGTELRRVFPTGTSATVRVEGDRSQTSRGSAVLGSDAAGAAYGASARLSVTHPLLRGSGTQVGEAELRAARINHVFAGKTKDRVASELVRDVLSAYWELWYARRAVEIDRGARALAEAQRKEANQRVKRGALSPVEALPFETRVATLDEQVVASTVAVRQRELELEQLVGDPVGSVVPSAEPPGLDRLPVVSAVSKTLETRSPELIELRERVRLAKTRAKVAGDAFRPRLDVSGWVEAAGLSQSRILPAYGQVAGFEAVSVNIGLVYEMPLTGERREATKAQSELAVKVAAADLRAARQRIRVSALVLVNNLKAARASLAAAKKTVSIAQRQFQGEQKRFARGDSTAIEVQSAEDQLRQARLRVASARVTQARAKLQLEHSTGELLRRYARLVQQGPRRR